MKKRAFLTAVLCIGFLITNALFIGFTSIDSKGNCTGYGMKCFVIDLRDGFLGYRADLTNKNGKLVVSLPIKQLSRTDYASIIQNGLNITSAVALNDKSCDELKKAHGTIIKAGKYPATAGKTEITIILDQPVAVATDSPAVNRQR